MDIDVKTTKKSLVDEKKRSAAIGGTISKKRIGKKISQEALAKTLGINGETMRRDESGESRISAARLSQIADHLGEPIEEFFEDVTPMPSVDEMGKMVAKSFKEFKSRTLQKSVLNIVTYIAKRDDTKK